MKFCRQVSGIWRKHVIINKANIYCCVGHKSKAILLTFRIYVCVNRIHDEMFRTCKQATFVRNCIDNVYIPKQNNICVQGHLVVPHSIVVSALVAADVTKANWPPSVQKPMGDDPVQSLESDQLSHTPIPLTSVYFLPYNSKFSWRFLSHKVLGMILWFIISPKRPTVAEHIVRFSW